MKEGIPTPANGPFERSISLTRPERGASLDLAKVNEIHRIASAMREEGAQPYLFGDIALQRNRAATHSFDAQSIVDIINRATEDLIRKNPSMYLALLERVEAGTSTSQDDE